jgi:hypothetical protein
LDRTLFNKLKDEEWHKEMRREVKHRFGKELFKAKIRKLGKLQEEKERNVTT